jgi:hypothetical protein
MHSYKLWRLLPTAALLTILALAISPLQPVRAAPATVDITTDELDGADAGACTSATLADYDGTADGTLNDISLREAICWANAAAGTDDITVPTGTYTLTLGSQLPTITTEMTITGNGQANTIIQAAATPFTVGYRVFEVTGGGNLTLANLTVQNGGNDGFAAGGGNIMNDGGTLTLDTVTVRSGQSKTGGGIFSHTNATTTITDSTITNNLAEMTGYGANGGGIYSFQGSLIISGSTISNNTATTYGGGVYNINNGASPVQITNSTFSGNSAGVGGGLTNEATASSDISSITISHSTFADNSATNYGGGIYNSRFDPAGTASITLENTLVANSTSGVDCQNGGGATVTTNGVNLIESDSGCADGGDITGVDPILGVLWDNGGPTWTHALLPGSPAIDAGEGGLCLTTDQRGQPRGIDGDGTPGSPQAGDCDIGAYERSFLLTLAGAGTGQGTMAGGLALNCASVAGVTSGICTERGVTFSITATTSAGSTFGGWAGCDSVSGASGEVCNITLIADATVTAIFLTPQAPGPGGGGGATCPACVGGAESLIIDVIPPTEASNREGSHNPFVLDDRLVWLVEVTNPGGGAVDNVIARTEFDNLAEIVDITTTHGTATWDEENVVTANIGTLQGHETATITVETLVIPVAEGCTSGWLDWHVGDDTECVGIYLIPGALPLTGGGPTRVASLLVETLAGAVIVGAAVGWVLIRRRRDARQ